MTRKVTEPSPLRAYVFGGAAHGAEVAIYGHVLDRIKVQCESQGRCQTIPHVFRQILQEGKSNLYKGFKWNLLISTVKGSHGWVLNNFANRLVTNFMPQIADEKSFKYPITVGIVTATMEGVFIITPLERMKTVEMTSNLFKQNKVLASTQQALKEKGAKFFFTGLSSVILRQIVTWTSYLCFYDLYKSKIEHAKNGGAITYRDKVFVAGLAGTSACLVTSPIDFYKTQKQMLDSLPTSNSTAKNVKYLISKYGLRSFFSGFSCKIVRSSLSSVVVFSILDYTNSLPKRMRMA